MHYTEKYSNLKDNDYIEKFLYRIYFCKAVTSNSYHATLFSILLISLLLFFSKSKRGNERFNTIKVVYNIEGRLFKDSEKPNLSLLTTPLKINSTKINFYRKISLEYLKKNLFIL